METNIDKKPSEILAGAIEILAGGEHWIKEELFDDMGNYCLLGAVSKSYYGESFRARWCENMDQLYPKDAVDPVLNKVNDFIKQATGGLEGYEVNDAYETEFEDVHAVLCKATKLAFEAESKEEVKE